MHKLMITGRVGRDPEEKIIQGEKILWDFPIAVGITKSKEKVTVWYSVKCWNGTASIIMEYIKKGTLITVIGDLSAPRTFQKENGEIVVNQEIKCDSISFLPISKDLSKLNVDTGSSKENPDKQHENKRFDKNPDGVFDWDEGKVS